MGCFLPTLVYGSCVIHSGKETRTSAAQISQRFREATIVMILENLFQKYFIIKVLSLFSPFLLSPYTLLLHYSLFLIGSINCIKSSCTRQIALTDFSLK